MIGPLLSPLLLLSGAQALPAPASFDAAVQAFRAAHGPSWQCVVDAETGYAEMLHGGGMLLGLAPRDEAEAARLAEDALRQTAALHGVDPDTLTLERGVFLPLGQIGSSDKWTVRFAQRLGGLPVEGARVNVLIDAQGRLLSVHSTAVPRQNALSDQPSVTAEQAVSAASARFVQAYGVAPQRVSQPELLAARALRDGRRTARAAWQVDLGRDVAGAVPLGQRMWIDASTGALLRSESTVHEFDVTGTVQSKATPGTGPDVASNPETIQVLRYARVQSSAGTVYADASGNFTYPGVNTPLSCTFTYVGTYNNVTNSAGSPYSLAQTIQPNTPTTVLMNPSPTDPITAQANAFISVNKLRDWVRTIVPTDATADITFLSHCNLSQTCNAYFDGSSINFFSAGGGCPNTSYSTVVNHEQGHWMNVLYGTGNGGDGMGEGNADVFAMYIWDTPVVGQDFLGPGTNVRTGTNTSLFCGDAHPACYGEVHADGEPWMGAAWKIRNRLNQTLGNAPGDLVADTIFLSWMNAYNQGTIRSIIETQWLTLDDDDANINNGTPHFTDIDNGFRDQGFPGYTLVPLAISNVTALADTQDQTGPYTVDAAISANFNPPLTAKTLYWRVNGGAFQSVPMSLVSGSTYRATIPGQVGPALVQYYVEAADSAARVATWPATVPDQLQSFDVGVVHLLGAYNFDGGTAGGWTAGTVGDTSNPENDWARGAPQGRGGNVGATSWRDPAAAASSPYCFANDLGSGSNDGAYSANVHSWLRSPAVNCTGATNVRLRFSSWVSVEGNAADQARVLVNGVEVYANPASPRLDTAWGMQEYDISALAANNPSVEVEFRLRSNGTNQYGGWAVDDVSLFWLSPVVVPCPQPVIYCSTAPNTVGGGALMAYTGTGNIVLNNLRLFVWYCPPNTSGQFYYGPTQIQVPFGNGFRCVGGTAYRLGAQQTDASGNANRLIDLNNLPSGPAAPGQVWNFQFWYRNPAAGGAGYNLSDALSVTLCQ